MKVKVNKAAEGTRLLKMLLLLISWKHPKSKGCSFQMIFTQAGVQRGSVPNQEVLEILAIQTKNLYFSMKSWFKYYCQPQTLVGWLCWMCIRCNSTAASFPARTSSQCGCLAGHSTRSPMDPLLGQKSWVAKPAIILPLFWSLTFGNLASTTSPAVIIMCMHPLVSRRKN